jgi:DNA-binding transcriptional ArsR family regulator
MSALSTPRDLKAHFVGLANPTRLAIIALLVSNERTASEIARKLKLSQPLMSWHLDTRRSGREVLCSLDRNSIREYQERFNQLIREPEGASQPTLSVAPPVTDKEIANAI